MNLFYARKHLSLAVMIGLCLLTFASASFAQVVKTITIDSPDNVLMMNEFGGLITGVNDTIKVDMVIPPDQRDDAYSGLDIRTGDIILMANGEKLNSIKTLKDIYENADIGQEIKLAISRDSKMMLVKFTRADLEALPGGMQITTLGGDDEPLISPLIDAGLMLTSADDHIVISDIVNNLIPEFKDYTPQKGDIIMSIQGHKIKSSEDIELAYTQIETGESVSLLLVHDSQTIETSFIKPEGRSIKKVIRKVE